MIKRFRLWAVVAALSWGSVGSARSAAAAEPVLQAGDRVLFFGDSITQAGAGPGGYVTLIKETLAARRPELKVEVLGAGVSGNRVPDLEKRLDRDVLSKKPTLVVIYIGINDVWHFKLPGRTGTPKDEFEQGLRRIIKRIQDAGARVALCTPSVIGERGDGSNQLDPMLDEYSDISRRVAQSTNSQLVDLRRLFLKHLQQNNRDNAGTDVLTSDGVHLNAAGNRFVADRMLVALGVLARMARAQAERAAVLRHIVLFKFKDDLTAEQVREVVDAFRALPGKIDRIADFEWGTDVSSENRSQGFTHCAILTFNDQADLDAYLPHEAHLEFVKLGLPRMEKVLVVDYVAQK